MLEHHFFLEHYTTYTIQCSGHFVTIKFPDILVTFRTEVIALILVKTEVELCSMLYHSSVKRRKQYMILVVKVWYRHHKQTVILTCITVDNC